MSGTGVEDAEEERQGRVPVEALLFTASSRPDASA